MDEVENGCEITVALGFLLASPMKAIQRMALHFGLCLKTE